jgi:hypothetical protein
MKKCLLLAYVLTAAFWVSEPVANAAGGQAHISGGGGRGIAGGRSGFRGGVGRGYSGRWAGRGYGHWRGDGRYWHHRWYPGYGWAVYGFGYPYYDYYYPYDYPFAYYGDTPYYGYNDAPAVPAGSVDATVQSALARRGYYRGEIDGILGPASYRAIRAFQADKGLPVTGQIDSNLLRALRMG